MGLSIIQVFIIALVIRFVSASGVSATGKRAQKILL